MSNKEFKHEQNLIRLTGFVHFFESREHITNDGEVITYLNAAVMTRPMTNNEDRKKIDLESFPVSFQGRTADWINKNTIESGDLVCVHAVPRMDTYEDGEGKKHKSFRAIGFKIELVQKAKAKETPAKVVNEAPSIDAEKAKIQAKLELLETLGLSGKVLANAKLKILAEA